MTEEMGYYKGELIRMINEIEDEAAMRYMYIIVKDIHSEETARKLGGVQND